MIASRGSSVVSTWLACYCCLFLFSSLLSSSHAAEVHYEWDFQAVLENDISPDCMNIKELRRYLFLANREFPGPTIDVQEGDTIHVKITNHHPSEEMTIHWHGIHQFGTPYMDGLAMITQCNLGVQQSQEYIFTAYPAGTHYWHAHGNLQLADGVSGALIVRSATPEPFTYDEERLLFFQDWYDETSTQQLIGLTNWPFTWIGNPNSLLINGKGIAGECLPGGLNYNNSLVCIPEVCEQDPSTQLNVTTVESGKTYRLRLINSGQLVMVNFAIAMHSLTIVQVEGTNVEPVTVDSLDIAPGMRYDVLLTANQAVGTYWIETAVRERSMPGLFGKAILQYVGADLATPVTDPPNHTAWNASAVGLALEQSLVSKNVSQHPEHTEALTATNVTRYIIVGTQNNLMINGEPKQMLWAVNNVSNIMPMSEPLIAPAIRIAKAQGWPTEIPNTGAVPETPPTVWNYTAPVMDPGGPGAAIGSQNQAIISLRKGQVLELVLQNARAINGVAEFHPWHSHGYSFWVVGMGLGSIYNPETDPASYNLVNPVLRDTLNIWPVGWTAIRLVANNPGVWFFHCHITSHHLMGMGFQLVVQPDELDDPPASVKYCDDESLTATDNNDEDEDDNDKNKDDKDDVVINEGDKKEDEVTIDQGNSTQGGGDNQNGKDAVPVSAAAMPAPTAISGLLMMMMTTLLLLPMI